MQSGFATGRSTEARLAEFVPRDANYSQPPVGAGASPDQGVA